MDERDSLVAVAEKDERCHVRQSMTMTKPIVGCNPA